MPMPTPNSGESEGKFVSRCLSFLANEGSSLQGDQAVAACYSQFRRKESTKLADIVVLDGHPTAVSQGKATEGVIAGQYPELDMSKPLSDTLKPGALKPGAQFSAGRLDFNKKK